MEIIKCGNALGEGPCFDPRTSIFFWVDIMNSYLHVASFKKDNHLKVEKHEVIKLENAATAVMLTTSSDLLLLSTNFGLVLFDWKKRFVKEVICRIIEDIDTFRLNDAKVSPNGAVFVGSMSLQKPRLKDASFLYRYKQERVSKIVSKVTVSNGMDWRDGKFYYVDSPRGNIMMFDYDKFDNIWNEEVLISLKDYEGFPDGMTLDKEVAN